MYVSLICVGFASWTISNNGSGSGSSSASASIIADDVINSSEIVNISDFTVFDYFKNGFVNNDGYITASGNITAKLTLNIEKCKSMFAGRDNLKVVVSLSRSNLLTLVGDYTKISVSATVGGTAVTPTFELDTNTLLIAFTINNFASLTTAEYTIKYTFTILDKNYFINSVFPELYTNDVDFTLSARVTDN